MITLGRIPEQLVVNLVAGDPWTVTLHRKDAAGATADWSSAPTIVFDGGPTWVAAIAGSDATWTQTAAAVDAAIAACKSRQVKLSLDGYAWATGTLVVN